MASVQLVPQQSVSVKLWTEWVHYVQQPSEWDRELLEQFARQNGRFGMVEGGDTGRGVRFPLWYPALAFSLTGVGVGYNAMAFGRVTVDATLAYPLSARNASDGDDGLRFWTGITANF